MNIIKKFKDWHNTDRVLADYYEVLKALNLECEKNRQLQKENKRLEEINNELDMRLDEALTNLNKGK